MSSGKKGFINTKETSTKTKKAGTSKNNFPEEKATPKKKVIIKPKKKYDSDDDTDDSDYDDNSHSRSESEDVIREEEVSESENETESSDEYGHHDSEDDSDDDNNDSDEESDDDDDDEAKDDEINGGGELGSLDSDDDDDDDSDSEDDDITDSDDDDDYDDDDDDEDYNQGFLRHKDSINLTKEEMVTGGKIPLPQGWEERFDERSQRVYYVDHNTKTTHWDPPESVTQELMKRQGYTDCYGMDPDGYDRELYPDPALFAIEALRRGPPQGKKSSMKPPVRLIIDDSLAKKGEAGDDGENKGDVYIEDDGDKDVTDITEEEIDIRNSDHNYIADLILALITSINMSYEMFIPEDDENHNNGNKDEKKGNNEEEEDDGEDIIVIDDDDDDDDDDSDDDIDADEDKKNGGSDNNTNTKGKSKPNDDQHEVILNQPSPSPSLPNDADDQKQKGRRRKKSIDGTATATSPLATKVEGAGTTPGTNDAGENESHFDDEDDRSSGITESGSNDLSEAFEGESELVPLTEEEEEMRIFYVTHTHRISRPGSKYQLKVKDYAPTAFEFMRRMCHISRKEYLRLWNTPRLVTSARYKKSFALFSSDKRFILRIITHNEAKTLFKMLPEYIRYVVKNPQTTLPKIFGLHRLIKSSENIYFIVCNNMFGSKIRKSYYDVRSSSLTRKTIFSEASAEPSSDDIKMHIHEDDRNRLLKQIESDCNFLKQNRIMGYNLVVAITIRKKVDPNSESASASAASSTADDESKKRKRSKKKKDGNEEGNDDDFGGSQAGTNSLTTIQRIPTPTPGVVKIFCQQPKKGFVFFIEETYNPQLQNVPRKLKVATKGGNVATNGTQMPGGSAQPSSSTVSTSPVPTNNTLPQANSTSPLTSTPKIAQRTASPAIATRQQGGGDPATTTANSGSMSSSMPPSPMKANKKSSTLTESTLATSSCSITSDLDMSSGGGSISLPTASSLPDVDLNTWAAIVSEKKYKAVYSVAITNILKTYGMGAKFSEWFRSVKFRRDSLIDAEPNIYADRLIKFANEAIITKPPKKSKKKKNKDETKKSKK